MERDKPTLQGTHSVETVHANAQRPEGSRWSSPAPPRALNHTARLRRLALAHWCALNKFPNQNTEKPVLFTENLVSVLVSVTSTEKTTSRNLMTRKHTWASGAFAFTLVSGPADREAAAAGALRAGALRGGGGRRRRAAQGPSPAASHESDCARDARPRRQALGTSLRSFT